MTKFVTYYRVSTAKQGRSGLGIEGQKDAVRRHLKAEDTIVASFTEVESGRNNGRPQLDAAIRACRLHKATLLIAKLDRLSRNVAFLAQLLDGDAAVVCCDNPNATKFTLHILAAVAQHEAEMISHRTRAALAAARARGVRLGGWKGHAMPEAIRAKGCTVQRSAAQETARTLAPTLDELRLAGITTTPAIAAELNERCIPTPRGGKWHAASVARLVARLT